MPFVLSKVPLGRTLLKGNMVKEDKAIFGNAITHVCLFWAYWNPQKARPTL